MTKVLVTGAVGFAGHQYHCGICGADFDTADELRFHQQLGHLK